MSRRYLDTTEEVIMTTSATENIRTISASGGCAFTIETGEDGKLVISVDLDTVIEGLNEAASWGDISEDDVEYIAIQMAKGEVTVI